MPRTTENPPTTLETRPVPRMRSPITQTSPETERGGKEGLNT